MPKICYQEWDPTAAKRALVDTTNSIIDQYRAQGYTLSLRQLYYQFVARDLIPNTERSYKNLGNTITKARMAGLVDWNAIEDRNREHNSFWYEENMLIPVRNMPHYIRFDRWDRQETYVEVWVEKDALGSVVARACEDSLVPHMACKGYMSASAQWRAGQRFEKKIDEGKHCVLIHLGDHDPSGLDMTRDNDDRVNLFGGGRGEIEIRRIALNMDQVDAHNPPPNPTKVTDSRAADYIRSYGHTCWELDALEPRVIEQLIRDEIEMHVDDELWDEVNDEEAEMERVLGNVAKRWNEIEPIATRE